MKKIRVLHIEFDDEIKAYEIPAFRSAIIEKAGREHVMFHNHIGKDSFVYRYPLIQYKCIRNHPAIICIDQGVDEIHHFFENKVWDLDISGRKVSMKVLQLKMNQFNIQIWSSEFRYRINSWIALNQENVKKYFDMGTDAERTDMLTSILKANILSFAKGIEWTVDKQVAITINEIVRVKKAKLKGNFVMSFDVHFSSNVFLPNYIGLGKSPSLGFGIVTQIRENKNNTAKEVNEEINYTI